MKLQRAMVGRGWSPMAAQSSLRTRVAFFSRRQGGCSAFRGCERCVVQCAAGARRRSVDQGGRLLWRFHDIANCNHDRKSKRKTMDILFTTRSISVILTLSPRAAGAQFPISPSWLLFLDTHPPEPRTSSRIVRLTLWTPLCCGCLCKSVVLVCVWVSRCVCVSCLLCVVSV